MQDLTTTEDLKDILTDLLSPYLGVYERVNEPAITVRQKRENVDVTGLEVVISGRYSKRENFSSNCGHISTLWWFVKFYQHEGRFTLDDAIEAVEDVGYLQEYREADSDTIMKDRLYGILKITVNC